MKSQTVTADLRRAPGGVAGLEGPDPELLREFLAKAPEPLREWADQQSNLLDAGTRRNGSAPESADPAADANAAGMSQADLALEELGEDDEGRPRIHTPMDKEFTPVPRKQRKLWVPLVALLVVLALGYGVFRLGAPTPAAEAPAPNPQAGQGDSASRMAELEAKVADTPNDVAANLELGVLKFNAGDVEGAEVLWTNVTKADPRNPQAWFNLGFVALAQEPVDVAGAKAAWQQVLEVAPESDLAATVRSHLDALEASGTPSPNPGEE